MINKETGVGSGLCLLLSAITALILACNGNRQREGEVVTKHVEEVQVEEDTFGAGPRRMPYLPELMERVRRADPSFDLAAFPTTSDLRPADSLPLSTWQKGSFRDWRPFMIYNADSTAAIDLYSYSYSIRKMPDGRTGLAEDGEADEEAALLDLRTGQRRRLFFGGPGSYVLDAGWAGKDTALLAVALEEAPDAQGRKRYQLTLHRYDRVHGEILTTTYPGLLIGNPAELQRLPPGNERAY